MFKHLIANNIQAEFLPITERTAHLEVINAIANAIYGNEDEVKFTEEYIPLNGRVPAPKVANFANYLIRGPRLLWVIKSGATIVGFILVSDTPFQNALGIGINSQYARRGVISQALNQIKYNKEMRYPLCGYTSERNIPAQKTVKKLGFEKENDIVIFMGERSFKYKLEAPEAFGDTN